MTGCVAAAYLHPPEPEAFKPKSQTEWPGLAHRAADGVQAGLSRELGSLLINPPLRSLDYDVVMCGLGLQAARDERGLIPSP